MPTIQSLGVGSGLDVSSIITKLMELEQKPLKRLESAEVGIQTQISAYGTIQSKLGALDTAMGALSLASAWQATTVNTHERTEVTVTTSSTTEPTSLDVNVTQLAQKQSIATKAFDDASAVVGTGTLTITLGRWSGDFVTFPAIDPETSLATSTTPMPPITITSPNDTLSDIRDAINAADAGVEASILSDATGARLVLRSTTTGQDSGFKIETSSATGDFGALTFTTQPPEANATGAKGHVLARNLSATINGVAVQATTNTLTNVLDGITLTAKQVTATPMTVDIEADTAGLKTQIETFTTAYNDAVAYIKQITAYNEATKKAGPLQGDQVTLSLLSQLRSAVTRVTLASNVFDRLSDIGITLQKDGSLGVAGSKLQGALDTNLAEVQTLFSRNETDANLDGLAVSVATFIDTLTAENGLISSKEDTLKSRLKRNQADQDAMSLRLESIQARLEATYSALDTKMGSLNSLSSYVSQQITAINNSQSKN